MACPTGRCALRRFDGHGTNSYRPTNTEAARQLNSDMEKLLAARAQQDSCWLQPASQTSSQFASQTASLARQATPEFGGSGGGGGSGESGAAATATAKPLAAATLASEIPPPPTEACWSLSS
jgi:hypothetical protein